MQTDLLLHKLFGYDSTTMSIKKEVLGGITTFIAIASIFAINPTILSEAGMDKGGVFTATIISSVIATLIMSMYAKLPFALSTGMGLNYFFSYTICRTMGYSWQFALTAVFVEGIIFILLSATGLRSKIVESIPAEIRDALPVGIGMFLALISLNDADIIVTTSSSSLPSLGDMTSTSSILTFVGIGITSFLILRGLYGAILWGVIITTIIGIPLEITHFTGIVQTPPSLSSVALKFEWSHIFTFDMLICVMTLLFMDMFDTVGSIIGVCSSVGMVDKEGKIPHINEAFMADAVGTTVGAMLGTSTVTTFLVSATGVNVGGRSGLTSFVTAMCFLLVLFFSPLFLAIPTQATTPAIFLVGVTMMHNIKKIDFSDMSLAIPCFICIFMIPMTSSIPNGIMLGLISYVLINVLMAKWNRMNLGMYILSILFVLKYIFL